MSESIISCEKVYDVQEFYERHTTKIAERLQNFNYEGSNLLIQNIAHIHTLLNVFNHFM